MGVMTVSPARSGEGAGECVQERELPLQVGGRVRRAGGPDSWPDLLHEAEVSTAQYIIVQYSKVQYGTVQYNTR